MCLQSLLPSHPHPLDPWGPDLFLLVSELGGTLDPVQALFLSVGFTQFQLP